MMLQGRFLYFSWKKKWLKVIYCSARCIEQENAVVFVLERPEKVESFRKNFFFGESNKGLIIS